MHRFFESIKYNSLDELKNMSSASDHKYLDFLNEQTEIPLFEILKFGFVEWGFGLKYNDILIQGQIDVWGIIDDTVYILDYKTGRSDFLEKAYEQLNFYATCLKKMNKIKMTDKIILGVLYPEEKKVFKKNIEFQNLKDLVF